MDDTIYNIVKENNIIGKGSFGKIYYYPKSYPNYIVKRMKKYNTYGNNFILNNLKELWWYSLISKYDLNINDTSFDVDNLININFSNIPKMLDCNINSDNIHLLLEYRGSSIYSMLKEIIKKGQDKDNHFNNDKYIELLKLIPLIIYSCSKVLMQLHYSNIRHGDITFSNIVYNEKETNIYKKISIIDWGSIVFSKTVLNNYNQCSPEFAAPELHPNKDIDIIHEIPSIKSDIYSLGIVILHILDPNKYFLTYLEKYLIDSNMIDNQYEILDYIIKLIINKYQHINIEEYVDKRLFYLLKKMLDVNINTRIDIDSLYMDELFTKYRNEENQGSIETNFDKYFLKNILRKREPVITDDFKTLLIEHTYNYLKSFRSRIINNVKNSKYYKLIDTRIILMPVLELFYSYLNKMDKNNSNYISISCLDNLTCLKQINNNKNIQQNTNHYIVSFLCCIKWIDIIFNDDITIFHLYEYYTHLYNLLYKSFPETIVLDLLNFRTFFDLTFYNIFKKMDGIILTYPYFMDFKYDYLNHSDVKKKILTSQTL